MRKRIITFLFCLLVAGFTQAQVVFNPDNYVGKVLPDGMSIVKIDGKNYLKTALNGWSTTIAVSPTTVILDAKSTKFRVKAKYDNSFSKTPLDSLKLVVQACDATSKWATVFATDVVPPSTLTTIGGDVAVVGDTCTTIQIATQYRAGDWPTIVGDTVYVGIIEAYDPNNIADPDVLFDPATFNGTLPTGGVIVEEGGTKYLKVTVDGWNTSFTVDEKSTAGFNKFSAAIKYEAGTGGLKSDDANVFLQAGAEFGKIEVTGTDALDYKVASSDLLTDVTCSSLQIAVQDKVNGWDPVKGAIVYVGKVTMSYEEPVRVTPPATAVLEYTTTAPAINGLYDDAYDASVEYKMNRIALGTVNGQDTTGMAGKDIDENTDSYGVWFAVADMDNFYLYAEITDDDPINLGTSTDPWNNDGIEIFVDIKDRRFEGGKRIGSEQHQLRINLDADVATTKGVFSGPAFLNQATANDTVDIQFAIAAGSAGYNLEARIPWAVFFKNAANTATEALEASKAANALYAGKNIALELSLLDASTVDVRKSILNWANNTCKDQAYKTNEFYGQVTLGETGWPVGIRNQQAVSAVKVYPNPTNSQLTVDMANIANVEVYNLVGAKVLSTQMESTINVSSLEMGVYIVKATDMSGKVAVAKFNKN